jgi:hypothetical protein
MSDVISTRIQKNPLQAYNSDTEDNNDPTEEENANKRGNDKNYLFCTTYETLEEAQEIISLEGYLRYVKTTKSRRKNSNRNSKMYYRIQKYIIK